MRPGPSGKAGCRRAPLPNGELAGQEVAIDITLPGGLPWDGHRSMCLACGDGRDFPAGDDPDADKPALEASYCDPLVREPFIPARTHARVVAGQARITRNPGRDGAFPRKLLVNARTRRLRGNVARRRSGLPVRHVGGPGLSRMLGPSWTMRNTPVRGCSSLPGKESDAHDGANPPSRAACVPLGLSLVVRGAGLGAVTIPVQAHHGEVRLRHPGIATCRQRGTHESTRLGGG